MENVINIFFEFLIKSFNFIDFQISNFYDLFKNYPTDQL